MDLPLTNLEELDWDDTEQATEQLEASLSPFRRHLSRSLACVRVLEDDDLLNPVTLSELIGPGPVEQRGSPVLEQMPLYSRWSEIAAGHASSYSRAKARLKLDEIRTRWAKEVAVWERQVAAEREAAATTHEREREMHDEIVRMNRLTEELSEMGKQGDARAAVKFAELKLSKHLSIALGFNGQVDLTWSESRREFGARVQVPAFGDYPSEKSVRVSTRTWEVKFQHLSATELRRTYASYIAEVALGTANAVFKYNDQSHVDRAVIELFVEAPNPATGVSEERSLVSLVLSREEWTRLVLTKVDPVACVRNLTSRVSARPDELVAIQPLAQVYEDDARYIENQELISALDARPNLMELTPNEFEYLVQNLFERMGLDTRQTRASRDGGVDAIAYDPRPIIGGKIVIQAKRYKNVVGVSAVRDLYGTLQNEGGSKGILVTTSSYGKASFEFAKNKPLELIDGPGLLFLLKEHASIDARIIVPDNWRDPSPD